MNRRTLSKVGMAGLVGGLIVVGWFVVAEMGRDRARAAASTQVPPIPVVMDVATNKDVPVLVRGIGTVQAYKMVTVKSRVDGQIVKWPSRKARTSRRATLCSRSIRGRSRRRSTRPRPPSSGTRRSSPAPGRPRTLRQADRLGLQVAPELRPAARRGSTHCRARSRGDEAPIDTARLNLAYTDIRAPIDGRPARSSMSATCVQASQTRPLVNDRADPADLRELHGAAGAPTRSAQPGRGAARRSLAYGERRQDAAVAGKLTLIDNQIDQATGTLRLKAHVRRTPTSGCGRACSSTCGWCCRHAQRRLDRAERAIDAGRPDGSYAYVDQGRQHRRAARRRGRRDAGRRRRHHQGPATGDKVVVDGQYRLTNGSRVRIDYRNPTAAGSGAAAAHEHGSERSRDEHLRTLHPPPDRDIADDAGHPGVRDRRPTICCPSRRCPTSISRPSCRPPCPAPAPRRWPRRSPRRSSSNSPRSPASPR